jgi:hypothetical protein
VAPEPVQAPVQAPSKTLEDIRALVLQIKPDVRVSKLMEVFQLVGADKLSAIPEKDYDFVYEQFKEALAEQA